MNKEFEFPEGCRLLARWQAGEGDARSRLKEMFSAAIAGEYDSDFVCSAPVDSVHVSGSLNLMTLTIMHDLFGLDSAEFYKGDPQRYVRTTMLSRRLLGMNKLYISWPVYGLTAEALGQAMMYPDKFPPGSDPEKMLINKDNWQSIKTPDFGAGIPKLKDEMTDIYQKLTGLEPILNLSAPYSLAADIFGQEPLLEALVHDPEFVNQLLDHLVDQVLKPWCDHFFARHPNGWVELSDASGSPFFIGPQNCKTAAIRAIRHLTEASPWGHRVYDCNYRGDYVTQVIKKDRRSRRRGVKGAVSQAPDLLELTDLKHSVCPDFIIRLDDDRVPVSFYEDQAIARNIPLFTGIGASQIDRNSIEDMDVTRARIAATAKEYVGAMKKVATTIAGNGYDNRNPPWPGTMYFEDISSESSFDLIEILIGEVLAGGGFEVDARSA